MSQKPRFIEMQRNVGELLLQKDMFFYCLHRSRFYFKILIDITSIAELAIRQCGWVNALVTYDNKSKSVL